MPRKQTPMSDSPQVTMQDIAAQANVSLSTVSFVLNGKRKGVWVGEDTRQRVLATAAEMGYQPNDLARAVVSGKNRMLGFLGYNGRVESAGRMLESALDEAESQGYTLKVLRKRDSLLDATTILQCVRLRLAGVIALFPGDQNLESLRTAMARYRIPVALVDNSQSLDWGIRIVSDDELGIRMAVDYVASLGHRQIIFVSGPKTVPMFIEREAGYRGAMTDLGLPMGENAAIYGNYDDANFEREIGRLFEQEHDRPTAIICVTDQMAMIAIRSLRRLGLHVPNDVSVVGFADLTIAQLCDPPLTTIAQPFEQMGSSAVRHLLARIDGPHEKFSEEAIEDKLEPHLVIRSSTAPPPHK